MFLSCSYVYDVQLLHIQHTQKKKWMAETCWIELKSTGKQQWWDRERPQYPVGREDCIREHDIQLTHIISNTVTTNTKYLWTNSSQVKVIEMEKLFFEKSWTIITISESIEVGQSEGQYSLQVGSRANKSGLFYSWFGWRLLEIKGSNIKITEICLCLWMQLSYSWKEIRLCWKP